MKRKNEVRPVTSTRTLIEAVAALGIDPMNTGYKTPKQRVLNIDRIIPGTPDRVSPCMADTDAARRGNARKTYTVRDAQHDLALMAQSPLATHAYVEAFCRLNKLTLGAYVVTQQRLLEAA